MTLAIAPAAEPAGSAVEIRILSDRCAGCQECVVRCPTGALSLDATHWLAEADVSACVGCRQCVRTCPFSAIVVNGPVAAGDRAPETTVHPGALVGDASEVRQGFASLEEAQAEAARCLSCPDPTCVRGCPAHNDIPGFVAAVHDGDLEAASTILRRTSVLSDVCSRVCNQASQCEGACSWALAGAEPVAIGRIERFVADHAAASPLEVTATHPDLSVAVIGSGPAGIGAAWALREAGAAVTVFERDEEPGGLCNWGIPDFTLPAAVAQRPWRQLLEAGVELRTGHEVDQAELGDLLAAHDAVVLCHGAGEPLRRPVPGTDLAGVTDATAFLQHGRAVLAGTATMAALREAVGLEAGGLETGGSAHAPRVLVLGAGNTAMDVARTARRLGMEASCVDWLDEANALARPDELAEARDEGVDVRFLRTLSRLEGRDGRVATATLARTEQARPDRPPTVIEGADETVHVDLVVMAMGYRVEATFAPLLPGTPLRREAAGIPDRHWVASGLLAAPATRPGRPPIGQLALGRERGVEAATLPFQDRLWVAGDALVGPSTVVEAMAQGRRAAAAILTGRPGRTRTDGPPRRVLVAYESRGGTTAKVAEEVALAFSADGARVRSLPIAKVGPAELISADLVVLGTWVEGRVVAAVHPARALTAWLDGLGRLGGREVAVFCTYAVAPKGVLGELRAALEAKGARVVGEAAFNRRVAHRQLPAAAGRFVDDLVAASAAR